MRGLESGKTHLRREVFTEIARMAYEGGNYERKLEQLPYKIIPGETETYRCRGGVFSAFAAVMKCAASCGCVP